MTIRRHILQYCHHTNIGVTRSLYSGEFADFLIICKPYEFKTHRVVLCAESKYFQTLCAGSFKVSRIYPTRASAHLLIQHQEATDNIVRLDDQQPLMIGRMLQFLYHGSYDVLNLSADLTRFLDVSSPQTILFDATILAQDFDFEIHAAMYAMSDRFEILSLKSFSATRFGAELRSKHFRVADLVAAIDLVYTTTPEHDDGLRKWVVYRAQRNERELARYDDFIAVLKKQPDFAWDLARKYAKANYVWCTHCKHTIDLADCRCGLSGMCGGPICVDIPVKSLSCTRCKTKGNLQQEIPRVEGNVMLGKLGRTDELDAQGRKAPSKKKRPN
jgi:BTB/POZ domain